MKKYEVWFWAGDFTKADIIECTKMTMTKAHAKFYRGKTVFKYISMESIFSIEFIEERKTVLTVLESAKKQTKAVK